MDLQKLNDAVNELMAAAGDLKTPEGQAFALKAFNFFRDAKEALATLLAKVDTKEEQVQAASLLIPFIPAKYQWIAKYAMTALVALGIGSGGTAALDKPDVVNVTLPAEVQKQFEEAGAKGDALQKSMLEALAKLEEQNKKVDELKAEAGKKKVWRFFDTEGKPMFDQPYSGF